MGKGNLNKRAGWVCNEAKSVWVPTQWLCWLGFTLDLEKGSMSVPEGKVRALQHWLKVAVKQPGGLGYN